MTTETTVNKTISALYKDGTDNRDDLIIAVYQKHADIGLNKAKKAVADWMKAEGLATATARGIKAEFYDWLLEADPAKPRTAKDVETWAKSQGTPNFERHISANKNVADLVARAFEKGRKA